MSAGGRPLATVERAVAVLEALADAGGEPLGTGALARRTGVNASTVSRLLGTLADAGLVAREGGSGLYRLGPRLVHLGHVALAGLDLRALARPLLAELAAHTGETATLSLPAGGEAVTAEFAASPRSVISQARVGRTSVAHATAVGKVLLAYEPAALERVRPPLERFTPRTLTDPKELRRAVALVRERGYAEAAGEREDGLNAVAAPVLDAGGSLLGVLGVQGPDRFGERERGAALPDLLTAAGRLAAQLSGRAGDRPPA